jgi:peroxiredoxin
VPSGAFDSSRREFESRLPSMSERVEVSMQFTEDNERGWSRTFAVEKTPSLYLVNSRREFVWKQEGDIDPSALAAALVRNRAPTQTQQFRPLNLSVVPGDLAPDLSFEDDHKEQFALHRYRGRTMILNFWQSWSAPCLAELSRLQGLDEASKGEYFIVAFHGTADGAVLEEIRKRLSLSFPLVLDSQQAFAKRYGVRCWPTTITVNPDGRVQHIQLGAEQEHELRTDDRKQTA